jgi:5'-nucleotidase
MADVADEVWVCAPEHERSAISHAITMGVPLRVRPTLLPGVSAQAWSVSGTPADCVKLALEELVPRRPDVVISGINRGPNLGTDVLYSGTVAAAAEGMLEGLPSIAASLASEDSADYSAAAKFCAHLAKLVVDHGGLPKGTILNVNVPGTWRGPDSGIRVTRLGIQKYTNIFDKRADPRGRTYYWLCGEPVEEEDGGELDTEAVRCGYVSITPVHFAMTDDSAISIIRGWGLET